ncbi:T3SS effector HopA1 family protein [Nonomuraea sp. NPDC050556]|uniref:T3SS effector HopA1 family protein n=1 Tax=Nonomuraea sp. NPDC050556 TaxID=3364369 RepID=UPI00379528A4
MIHPDITEAGILLAGLPPGQPDLDQVLYLWYLARSPLPTRPAVPTPVDLDLGNALDAAHADATRYVGGWRAESTTPMGGVVARNGTLVRHLPRAHYTVPVRPGLSAKPGDALLVRAAWTWRDEDHGFWYTRRGPWPPPGAEWLTRTYLNTAPSDTPEAIATLTSLLATHRTISYQLKTPLSTDHGGRADAVVLYLGAPDAAALKPFLSTAAQSLPLRPARPRFTTPLAPGAGQADSSLEGESFGESRCALVAQAWLALPETSRHNPTAISQAIAATFTAAGLDPTNPHRLPPPTAQQPPTPASPSPASPSPAPLTPAPLTPAPLTSAPLTPAAPSPAPLSPAAPSPAPLTPAPLTPADLPSAPLPSPQPLTPTAKPLAQAEPL